MERPYGSRRWQEGEVFPPLAPKSAKVSRSGRYPLLVMAGDQASNRGTISGMVRPRVDRVVPWSAIDAEQVLSDEGEETAEAGSGRSSSAA